jgi:hypothetical protein
MMDRSECSAFVSFQIYESVHVTKRAKEEKKFDSFSNCKVKEKTTKEGNSEEVRRAQKGEFLTPSPGLLSGDDDERTTEAPSE